MYKLPLTSTHVSKGISPLQKSICLLPITNKPSWTSRKKEDQQITRVKEQEEQEDWLA